ncbi:MAG: alpha/beta hydrolase [Pseudomonadota bacterium]
MDREAESVRVDIGRGREVSVGFARYGANDGPVVLYFHGWPGSRLQARLGHSAALSLGLQLIALDRPGYGLTGNDAGGNFADWAHLVERFCERFRLRDIRVLGISGGGPYALACGAMLPHRVSKISIGCGAPPGHILTSNPALPLGFRALLATHRRFPGAVRPLLGITGSALRTIPPEWLIRLWSQQLPKPDRATLAEREFRDIIAASSREAFRRGPHGAYQDAANLIADWPFDLSDIDAPVTFWYGERDSITPPALAHRAFGRLNAPFYVLPNEGHYSLACKYPASFLESLR